MIVIVLFTLILAVCDVFGQTATLPVVTVSDVKKTILPDEPNAKEDVVVVRFRGTLHNTSKRPLFLAADSVVTNKIEILSDSGQWKLLSTSSWVEPKGQKYSACTKVESGVTFVFSTLSGMLAVSKNRTTEDKAVIRVYYYSVCTLGLEHHITAFVTAPIQIDY